MVKQIISYIMQQVEDKKELKLLQGTYLVLGLGSVILCGIVGLFNRSLGVGMLIFPLVVIVALCVNVVMWALIKLGLDAVVNAAREREERDLAEAKKARAARSSRAKK